MSNLVILAAWFCGISCGEKTKNGGEPARRPSAWVIKSSLKVSSHIKRIAATLCETHGTILTRCAGGQVFASWCMSWAWIFQHKTEAHVHSHAKTQHNSWIFIIRPNITETKYTMQPAPQTLQRYSPRPLCSCNGFSDDCIVYSSCSHTEPHLR